MQEVLHVLIIVHAIIYTIQYIIRYIVQKRELMVKRVRIKEMEGMCHINIVSTRTCK